MKVTVKPVGYLKTFLKDYIEDDLEEAQLHLECDTVTVGELLRLYKFDSGKVGFLILNENIVKPDCILKDGDRLVVLPMLAGG